LKFIYIFSGRNEFILVFIIKFSYYNFVVRIRSDVCKSVIRLPKQKISYQLHGSSHRQIEPSKIKINLLGNTSGRN